MGAACRTSNKFSHCCTSWEVLPSWPPGKYRAQLDFLLCKTLHADGVARQSRPWRKFQLSQGSESGAVHYPVHANIPVKKTNWHCQGPKSNSAIDKEAIVQAACNLSESEADSVTQLRQVVRHEMQKVEQPSQLAQVPHIVSRACAQLFPAKCAGTIKQAIWQDAGVVASVRETWRLWRSMRAVEGRTLVSMFRKWSFLARHLKARKLQRKLSKQTRRQKLLAYVDQAAEAASKHDVRRLYEVVNKLSRPRQKRVALRGPHNELLSAEEEADLLASHFSIRFKAVYEEDVALQKLPWSTEGNIQLDEYALSCACAAAPLRKAVPPGHPPSAVWRLIAQETAITVSRVVNQAWMRGTASVPRGWSDAFLVLLPKPDKNGADPKHLRPVGLQDQVGKLTLQSLLMPHKDLIYQHTNKYPQYAYTPGRSYRGALYRVFQHCDLVRSLCRKHHRNLQARYAGGDVTKLVGGLQVSVDLTQAFDQMPRWLLLKGMRAMGLEEDFVSVLMRWITQSEYEISHMGHTRRFDASRGVRQGCVASPILWIIFVHSICDELAGKVGYSRVCQILTLFADDFHGQWTFYSLAELEEALDVLALLFSTLHKFGMTVNASKSKAIMAVAGTQASQIKKKIVRVIENCPHLKVNDKGLLIPLVDSFVYLGVKASYKGFEDDTLHHRLAKGKANYWRLAKLLRGKHTLSSKTRMQLWRSCVWTSISYGLDCAGLTQQGISLLETSVPKPYGHLSPQTALLQDQVRKATKRSFKRACRRALQYGQAMYKGSTITVKMVQPSWLDCEKVTNKTRRSIRERKGLRVFCWNSGGLASGQWDELLLHIDPQAWDILLIQETHWAESRDFVTGPWSCIASSAGRGSKAGVLIMVHQRICHNSMLRAEHVLPGRLLRIRLPLPGKDLRHLQVICAYQKAWNSRQASSVIEQRSGFWNKLDAALASVPSRDVLILGGDLNVSIPMTTGTAGAGVSPPPQDGATDASDLIGIAKQHGLIFLNTWHGRGTPVHTFLPSKI